MKITFVGSEKNGISEKKIKNNKINILEGVCFVKAHGTNIRQLCPNLVRDLGYKSWRGSWREKEEDTATYLICLFLPEQTRNVNMPVNIQHFHLTEFNVNVMWFKMQSAYGNEFASFSHTHTLFPPVTPTFASTPPTSQKCQRAHKDFEIQINGKVKVNTHTHKLTLGSESKQRGTAQQSSVPSETRTDQTN